MLDNNLCMEISYYYSFTYSQPYKFMSSSEIKQAILNQSKASTFLEKIITYRK